MRRTHSYVFNKKGISVKTQTMVFGQLNVTIQSQEELMAPDPSSQTTTPFSGTQGTSTTNTSGKSLSQVVAQYRDKQTAIYQSCGFKKVAQLEKTIIATKRQYGIEENSPLPSKKVRELTESLKKKTALDKPTFKDLTEATTSH